MSTHVNMIHCITTSSSHISFCHLIRGYNQNWKYNQNRSFVIILHFLCRHWSSHFSPSSQHSLPIVSLCHTPIPCVQFKHTLQICFLTQKFISFRQTIFWIANMHKNIAVNEKFNYFVSSTKILLFSVNRKERKNTRKTTSESWWY